MTFDPARLDAPSGSLDQVDALLHRPVGDLVAEHPGWAPVFERLGIDFCCHGATALWVACDQAGLDEASVLDALEAADEADLGACPRLVDRPVAEVIEHIVDVHHAYLRHHLTHLDDLVVRVHAVHGERHQELAEVLHTFHALRTELDAHLHTEEHVVFPACRAVAASSGAPAAGLDVLVRQVLVEHDLAAELLARLHAVTHGYDEPADACASYRLMLEGLAEMEADVHRHVNEEQHVLFPAVLGTGVPGRPG